MGLRHLTYTPDPRAFQLSQSSPQGQQSEVALVGFMGSVTSIKNGSGSTEWEKWYEYLGSRGLAKALDPLFITGRNSDPRRRHVTIPSISETEMAIQGIQVWLDKMNKYARETDATIEAHFNLLDQGIGLPDAMEPQRLDLQRRFPLFFEATSLPLPNPAKAKLEMMRGLLIREFGKAVTEDTVQATVNSMTLKPLSVASLLPTFLHIQRLISSMGQAERDNEKLLMKMFTRWLRAKYPAYLQAFSNEYARYIQSQGMNLADVRSNNILDEPDFAHYETVIRLMVKCTQQYDTSAEVKTVAAAERPWQDFPTVAAMAAGVHVGGGSGNPSTPMGTQWVPATQAPVERNPGWHGGTPTTPPLTQPTPPQQGDGTPGSPGGGYPRNPRPPRPRDQVLPDISTLFPGTVGVVCEACGCGNHFKKECTWITRIQLPRYVPHLPAFMQAFEKSPDYFAAVCQQVRAHGFMSAWPEKEYEDFAASIKARAQRRAQDPNRAEYESRQNRYGASPSPPQVTRNVDNRPAWITHGDKGQSQASR